jgi:NADPH-dependent 2,4-dienoyl-CoA reductase/sulfur reductase-like enzyme
MSGHAAVVETDILVVGAGPAGMAAAAAAANADPSARVLLLDNSPAPGGQIWREGIDPQHGDPAKRRALARLESSHAIFSGGWRVVDAPRPGVLTGFHEDPSAGTLAPGQQLASFHYQRLILATGARERYLPFPGWTLPGVFGAGGLQALVKSGFDVRGKRVAVAGTGPLLLAVAAHLAEQGARVVCLAEQAPLARLTPLAASLWTQPAKLLQGLRYRATLARTPLRTGCWVTEARAAADGWLRSIRLTDGARIWDQPCDLLAVSFHLTPNTELPALLGCRLEHGAVWVDGQQRTSVPDVFCAGEPCGIAGVNAALIEGEIAGLAAAGRSTEAAKLSQRRETERAFGRRLDQAFALRDELRSLATPDTLLCRCEDVRVGQVAACHGWTEAKLQTRCGMGPCQGRICGPAVEALFGWTPSSVRPPLYPIPVAAWCGQTDEKEEVIA